MIKLLSAAVVLQILLIASGCGVNSSTSAQLTNQPKTNSSVNSNAALQPDKIEPLPNEYPSVLYGGFHLRDPRKNLQTTVDVALRGEDVRATVNRGFDVKLPPVGTIVKMDIMNCAGYLGTASVTYRGLQQIMEVWTAELISETKIADLEQKLLQCVDKPNDEFTRKYLSNSIYFIAPSDEKRKQIKNVKIPDWKAIVPTIPYEWRKVAKLPMFPTKKQAEECISNWLDSDGDGEIDLLALCAFNEESVLESGGIYQYSRVLRLVNGSWREIWQTTDTKN